MAKEIQEISKRGIVLRTNVVRESDLFCTILLEEHGKIVGVARGGKNSKRRFPGGLNPFDTATFHCTPPRHKFPGARDRQEIYTLESLTDREIWLGLSRSLKRFVAASICLEAADALCHEGDPEGGKLCEPLLNALRRINVSNSEHPCEEISQIFLLEALAISGLDPESNSNAPKEFQQWIESLRRGTSSGAQHSGILLYLIRLVEEGTGKPIRSAQMRSA